MNDEKLDELAVLLKDGRRLKDEIAKIGIIADQVTAMRGGATGSPDGLSVRVGVLESQGYIRTSDDRCSFGGVSMLLSASDMESITGVILQWLSNKRDAVLAEYERL